ncbi:hypothetical protein [Streptomyces glaucosporus]|uniref:hypothetical protein n=1 Tax=Streptomyces glaucosporus TaxID=284044 RepID=UPI0031DA8FCA
MQAVAQSLPPRHIAWAHAWDVPPGTGVAQQVDLMRSFVVGNCTGEDFARGWLRARLLSLANDERIRDPLAAALDRVFFLLEDYSIDPDLREPEDLPEDDLRQAVQEVMEDSQGFRSPPEGGSTC